MGREIERRDRAVDRAASWPGLGPAGGASIGLRRPLDWLRRLEARVPLLAVPLAGILASLAACLIVILLEDARSRTEFEGRAEHWIGALHHEIEVDLDAIASLEALYASNLVVQPEAFQAFADALLARNTSLQTLEWLPAVRAEDRAAFEQALRETGSADFRILERGADGGLRPAARREVHYPVTFVEPREGNAAALGLDLGSDPSQLALLQSARDSGEIRVSPPIERLAGSARGPGFLMVAPIYQARLPRGTLVERRLALRGFVLGAVDLAALVGSATTLDDSDRGLGSMALDVRIYEAEPASAAGPALYAGRLSVGLPPAAAGDGTGPRIERRLRVADRVWWVVLLQPRELGGVGRTGLPWAVLIAGLSLSLAVSLVLASRQRGMARLAALAAELDEKNGLLEDLSAKLSRYVSRELAHSLHTGQLDASITARRRCLTVFFSDIQGFTRLSARLEPEALAFLLNDYFAEMTAIAAEHGATIDKFVGDAILIYFGDPESRGRAEDALRCVRMALAMQARMVHLRDTWQALGFHGCLHVRMGVSTGECFVGSFGSGDYLDYTAIGEAVNVAVRLHSIAEPDAILMTEPTLALVAEQVAVTRLAAVQLKGIQRPVVPYAVLGLARPEGARPSPPVRPS